MLVVCSVCLKCGTTTLTAGGSVGDTGGEGGFSSVLNGGGSQVRIQTSGVENTAENNPVC